jgi:hypothetical protein
MYEGSVATNQASRTGGPFSTKIRKILENSGRKSLAGKWLQLFFAGKKKRKLVSMKRNEISVNERRKGKWGKGKRTDFLLFSSFPFFPFPLFPPYTKGYCI